ncbi:geranylgeranylglyceryl phosphate synthase [Echinicola pacifica]|uniref:Geranylgeranylglyceryl phosphate synthase n=1 Tax=Echinicola pacifica TaxID=346377 RepID=A0A918PQX0_9BACT|nr:geranylgeranylglyceryl/heptaprenylglyceryl phosphate synthase [Echinicola pacifica]GGZ19702.1 geranylgeranylglyceryl phosphate synthase [Echinicola pacifica]
MTAQNRSSFSAYLTHLRAHGKKGLAVLVDPEKASQNQWLDQLLDFSHSDQIGCFLVGGSLILENNVDETILKIKAKSPEIPVILFPGNVIQLSAHADGILFLTLISGRNPDLLIGQQVAAAPLLYDSKLEVLPTGYMLVGDGPASSASYISQTIPLPSSKPALAVATAMAGHLLGQQFFFLDAGSGAASPVNAQIIKAVANKINRPLIVGGGINTPQKAQSALEAGADLIVLGNSLEKNPGLLSEVLEMVSIFNLSLNVN